MRQLFPSWRDGVDPLDGYGMLSPSHRPPAVRVNMISSIDGASSVGGLSGALGGSADQRLFMVLRSLADVVVVGAGTMRSEGYGPARLTEELQRARRHRQQAAVPPIAVVTRSCALDWGSPFFMQATIRPIVLTASAAPASRRQAAAEVADVVVAGHDEVDIGSAMQALRSRGATSVLVEGGPTLNAQLVAEGLLDELCLTLSPRLVAGEARRILFGPPLERPAELELASIYEEDGFVFFRYRMP